MTVINRPRGMPIFDAAMLIKIRDCADNLSGKEYGREVTRLAKGTSLMGVSAVIAESLKYSSLKSGWNGCLALQFKKASQPSV